MRSRDGSELGITPEQCSPGSMAIVLKLQQAGHEALFAGGCVRDIILGRTPKDFDVATSAPPETVQQIFPSSVAVGKAFGVVIVNRDNESVEVATFRQDHGYSDGRHPDAVSFVDAETDAQRRDFTVNALFYDPVALQVIDYVGGLADLDAGLIRTVGLPDDRFKEDHLRLLRAVRFTSSLNFDLDPDTATAIRRNAHLLDTVAAERVREEITRTLVEADHAGAALVLMDGLDLLARALPEVMPMKGQAQPPEFHPEGDVFVHTVMMLDDMNTNDARLAMAVLLHDVGKPMTADDSGDRIRFNNHANKGAALAKHILKRLRFSASDRDDIAFMIGNHMRFGDVREMRMAKLRRMIGEATFTLELELHRLDCMASHGKMENYVFLQELEEKLSNEPVLPSPWITGRDVMSLGIAEGPEVGVWCRKAYDRQLDGSDVSRDALLDWLRTELGR